MKYFTKLAGTEQISFEERGKDIFRIKTSTQPFDGASQPDPEAKFYTQRTKIRDFTTQQEIRKQLNYLEMPKKKRIIE